MELRGDHAKDAKKASGRKSRSSLSRGVTPVRGSGQGLGGVSSQPTKTKLCSRPPFCPPSPSHSVCPKRTWRPLLRGGRLHPFIVLDVPSFPPAASNRHPVLQSVHLSSLPCHHPLQAVAVSHLTSFSGSPGRKRPPAAPDPHPFKLKSDGKGLVPLS